EPFEIVQRPARGRPARADIRHGIMDILPGFRVNPAIYFMPENKRDECQVWQEFSFKFPVQKFHQTPTGRLTTPILTKSGKIDNCNLSCLIAIQVSFSILL